MTGFRDYAHMDSYYKISNQGGEDDANRINRKGADEGTVSIVGQSYKQNGVQRQSGFMETRRYDNFTGKSSAEGREGIDDKQGKRIEVICAWCKEVIGEWSVEASLQSSPGTVSHGICEDCEEALSSDLKKSQGGAL